MKLIPNFANILCQFFNPNKRLYDGAQREKKRKGKKVGRFFEKIKKLWVDHIIVCVCVMIRNSTHLLSVIE